MLPSAESQQLTALPISLRLPRLQQVDRVIAASAHAQIEIVARARVRHGRVALDGRQTGRPPRRTSPCARLTRAAKQNMRMFRGHLSRSACRHVKHRAKRSGISQNLLFFARSRASARAFRSASWSVPASPAAPIHCVPPHSSSTAALCARSSKRLRRRCFSRRAISTIRWSRPRRASRARTAASSIRVSPIRRWRCSSAGWRCWKAQGPRARPRAACRP